MEIRQLTPACAADVNLLNEPFQMPGRFIPALENGVWSYRTELFETVETDVFPDENYDFDKINSKGIVFGAYEDDKCIGLAIFQDHWLKHMYLYDLKVNAAARGKGAGRALIAAGLKAAKERGYLGLYTHAQDNNLNACLFYLRVGFVIGGFDNRTYQGTKQQGKGDVIFYIE